MHLIYDGATRQPCLLELSKVLLTPVRTYNLSADSGPAQKIDAYMQHIVCLTNRVR